MSKKTTAACKYIVVVAEYDECGSDGMCIDNALPFDTPEDATKFIAEDFNDTISGMVESEDIDENELLDKAEVLKKIKKLKPEDSAEWDTPEETPVWVKWKIFAR